MDLLATRERAKRSKNFDEADKLRDQLLGDHLIHVDDRRRLWWPEGARPRDMTPEEIALAGGSSTDSASFAGGDAGSVISTYGW